MDPLMYIIGAVLMTGLVTHFGPKWVASAKAKEANQWAQQQIANLAPAAQAAESAAASFFMHPVQTFESVEHRMAREAAELAAKGIAHLIDKSPEDAKIEAANAVKALKDKLAADVLAMVQPPRATTPQ